MRGWGWVLTVVGFAMLVIGPTWDTVVSVGSGSSVHNIGLLADKLAAILIGGFLFLAGIILLAAASTGGGKVKADEPSPFDGQV